MPIDATEFLETPHGRLAYRQTPGRSGKTTMVWLSGLRSDMMGGKASLLHAAALAEDRPYLRFDYRGHGESDVEFKDTVVSDWREDALRMIDERTEGPLLLIGSSMGGCVALLSALARPERVRGLMLIAPAPDFTDKLLWPQMPPEAQKEIMETGFWMRPSEYEEPYPITKALIEDGRKWLIMDDAIKLDIPVRIVQGREDDAVPWEYAQSLVDMITSEDVRFTLVKDGDHRLSRPQDLDLLRDTALDLAKTVDSSL